jgi:hypothetical protein
MDTVNSFLIITVDDNGTAYGEVVNGMAEIPVHAQRISDGQRKEMYPRHIYKYYHRPDCAWFTEEMT